MSTSSKSSSLPPTSDTDAVPAGSDKDSSVRFGGLHDECQSVERAGLTQAKGRGSASMDLTMIRPGITFTKPPKRTGKDGTNARARWTNADIPEAQRKAFSLSFVPLVRETAGTRGPWDTMSPEQVQVIYDRVYPDMPYTVVEKDVWHILANYRIFDWRSSIGSVALEGVKKLIDDNKEQGIVTSMEDVSYAVKHLLGDGKTLPFCWRQCSEKGKAGRFQHGLILYALSAHMAALGTIPTHFRKSSDWPKAALILSVLAVERALNIWRTGEPVIPPKTAGHFSEQNWGDRVEFRNGHAVMNRKASKFIPVVDKLREDDWKKIIEGAYEHYLDRSKKAAEGVNVTIPAEASDDDFDMVSDAE